MRLLQSRSTARKLDSACANWGSSAGATKPSAYGLPIFSPSPAKRSCRAAATATETAAATACGMALRGRFAPALGESAALIFYRRRTTGGVRGGSRQVPHRRKSCRRRVSRPAGRGGGGRKGEPLGGGRGCSVQSGVPRPLLLRCLASYPVRFCISHTWGRALLFAAENAIIGCLNRPCPGSGRVDAESAGRCYLPTRKVPRRFHGRFLHIPWRRLYGTELGHPHAGWRVVHER